MCCTYNLQVIPDLWYSSELYICFDLAQAKFYTAITVSPSKFGLVNSIVRLTMPSLFILSRRRDKQDREHCPAAYMRSRTGDRGSVEGKDDMRGSPVSWARVTPKVYLAQQGLWQVNKAHFKCISMF
jgi:hypothetical protein